MTTRGYKRRQARFPEIGAIRKGAPKTERGYVGEDLTYFRVEFDAEDPLHDHMENIFRNQYGDEPKQIDVLLPFPTVDENFTASREAYLASGMVFRGSFWPDENDDYWVDYRIDLDTGERFFPENEKFDPWSPIGEYEGKKKKKTPILVKPRGRLRVIIPILNRLAFLTLRTGSTWDINFLDEQLRAIEYFQGNLTCIPLQLRRRPMQVSFIDDGERKKVEKWLVSIEANPSWVEQKLIETQSSTLPMIQAPDEFTISTSYQDLGQEDDEDNTQFEDPPAKPENPKRIENQWEEALIKAAVDLGVIDEGPRTRTILNKSPLMSFPFGALSTKVGVAYLIGYMMIHKENATKTFEVKSDMANALWQEKQTELVDKATEMLGG